MEPKFVGVDDGHHSIKVFTVEDIGGQLEGRMTTVPSRARVGRHLISARGDDEDGIYLTEDNGYFSASEHIETPDDTRRSDYPRSALNRVLVSHALHKAGLDDQSVIIATGLPVSYFYLPDGVPNQSLIDAKVRNLSLPVTTARGPLAKIVKNFVTTEAVAAYFDCLIGLDGGDGPLYAELQDSRVGVIDIGGKTTDCAVINPGGVAVDTSRSGSTDTGALRLEDAMSSRIRQLFELDNVPARLVTNALRAGKVRILGKEEDVSEALRIEKQKFLEAVIAGIQPRIGNGRDLDMIICVGGGSVLLKDEIKSRFPHAFFPEDPEFANARGMYKIAKYVMEQ